MTVKKRRQNDGRPPDTVKELLQKSFSKKITKASRQTQGTPCNFYSSGRKGST